MRIKKRTISTTVSHETAMKMLQRAFEDVDVAKFPDIQAKPKQPLPAPRFEGLPPRSLGQLALSCQDETGDVATDEGYTAGDYVRGLRTVYDKNNPQEARYRNRTRNRATAITAMCITCTGSRKLVRECAAVECPLWAFRLGSNPFRSRK